MICTIIHPFYLYIDFFYILIMYIYDFKKEKNIPLPYLILINFVQIYYLIA